MKWKTVEDFEIKVYFILWISAVSYAIYHSAKVENEFFSDDFNDIYHDFSSGWSLLNRKKDDSDSEWRYCLHLLKILIPWYFLHLLIAEFLRQYTANKRLINFWYIIISLTFVSSYFGAKIAVYFLFQPIVGFLIVQLRSKLAVWLFNIFSLLIINYYEYFGLEFTFLNNYEAHISVSAIAWINLRTLNYFLDATTSEKMREINYSNLLNLCGYCFYLPVMFLGPLVLFSDFNKSFEANFLKEDKKNLVGRLSRLMLNLLRFIFWIVFTEFALHFVYVNAMSFQPQVINKMGIWGLCGLGYSMGQFFQMKYVVFYGLSTTMASFEGIPVPSTPKCIGRIHLYSDMWKYFDQGLYIFLLRYIYVPLSGSKKSMGTKLTASLVCFSYVYIWHGIQTFIAVWSVLNFLGVATESICNEISKSDTYQNLLARKMSAQTHRRFRCAVATPLFAISALSNFYFFAGKEVGDIFVKKVFKGPVSIMVSVLTVLYFGSQVSTEVKLWEEKRRRMKKFSP